MAEKKILKKGQTNINSTDIWRFAFHSGYPTYKIIGQGALTLTANTPGGDLGYFAGGMVSHNLGYKPQSFVFADFSAYPPYPGFEQIRVTDVTAWYIFYYDDGNLYVSQSMDETGLYFGLESDIAGKSLTFGYIITLDEWQS